MQANEKEYIKHWIKATPGMSRKALSEICQVNKRTLDNWLSGESPIPPSRLALLKSVIQCHDISGKLPIDPRISPYTLEITFAKHEYYAILTHSADHHCTPTVWVRTQICNLLEVNK